MIKRLQAVLVAQPRAELRSLYETLTLSLLLFAASQAQAGACTREYMPVCGQLPAKTQTFSNRCMMKNAGAVMLHEGVCKPKPLTKYDPCAGLLTKPAKRLEPAPSQPRRWASRLAE